MRYVVNDPEHGPALYEEEWEASRQFDDLVTRLRERAANGWHPNAESAFWGEVILRERLSLRGTAQPDVDQGGVLGEDLHQSLTHTGSATEDCAEAEVAERMEREFLERQGWSRVS